MCFSRGSCENAIRWWMEAGSRLSDAWKRTSKFISVFCWIIAGALKFQPICGWFVADALTHTHEATSRENKIANESVMDDLTARMQISDIVFFFFFDSVIYLFFCFVQTALSQLFVSIRWWQRRKCSQTWHTWTHERFCTWNRNAYADSCRLMHALTNYCYHRNA